MHEDEELRSESVESVASKGDLAEFLHRRITDTCLMHYQQGHFKAASQEAMTQVELGLKEISLAPRKLNGKRLVDYAFGDKGAVSLSVPFGTYLQAEARDLFRAAFGYYRNYAVHEGSRIDCKVCTRILMLASELLDLLDVSPRCLRIENGPAGLVDRGYFADRAAICRFLEFIDGQGYPEDIWDGLLEDLAKAGFDWEHITLAQDLGLLEERTEFPGDDEGDCRWWTAFELTSLGRDLLRSLRR